MEEGCSFHLSDLVYEMLRKVLVQVLRKQNYGFDQTGIYDKKRTKLNCQKALKVTGTKYFNPTDEKLRQHQVISKKWKATTF